MSATPDRPDERGELINWSAALEATGDDEQLLVELIHVFLEEAPSLMTDIRRSIDQGDTELLRRAAHTLKGSLRIFETEHASNCAFQLEQTGKSGELSNATQDLAQLESAMEPVVAALRERVGK
jgi:HPt (histidine-containing phosphotransfer) domain-containing protein